MANIAIFGGTFNPLHLGHYQMLEALCNVNWIDKVLVMPDKLPPHKDCDFLASDLDRIEMCKIVCKDFTKAEPCLIEFEREGRSYSIDTVLLLKERFPADNFFFVCGGDMIASLDTWKSWERLIKETAFIAFSRKGTPDFEEQVERMQSLGATIHVIDREITEISSSSLRQNFRKDMLPEKIYSYIVRRNIYNG